MKCKVVHKRDKHDVYIGRGSIWGNRYRIGIDGTRKEVIEKYEQYLISNEFLMSKLKELEGKTLGCYCKPKACHGDVIAKYVNKLSNPFYRKRIS